MPSLFLPSLSVPTVERRSFPTGRARGVAIIRTGRLLKEQKDRITARRDESN